MRSILAERAHQAWVPPLHSANTGVRTFHWDSQWELQTPLSGPSRILEMLPGLLEKHIFVVFFICRPRCIEEAQDETCQSAVDMVETWIKGYLYAGLSGIVLAYIVLSLRAQKLSARSFNNEVQCMGS